MVEIFKGVEKDRVVILRREITIVMDNELNVFDQVLGDSERLSGDWQMTRQIAWLFRLSAPDSVSSRTLQSNLLGPVMISSRPR
jgi:hypothetical protein